MRSSRPTVGLALAGLALAAGLTGCTSRATPSRLAGAPPEAPVDDLSDGRDSILVDLKDGTSAEALRAFSERHKVELRWEATDPSVVQAALAVGRVPVERQLELLAELRKDDLVESAEHNQLYTIPDQGSFDEGPALSLAGDRSVIPEEGAEKPRQGFPNDALFDKQWHLAMIGVPQVWKKATGKGVIVGVIDTGVAYEKKKGIQIPDLAKTEFVPGYDFVNDDPIAADDHGHGSHCAGTIAQSTDNGRGCAGVAPRARIMPLKVLSRHGSGTAADICAAIRYAADHGCKVMNLSLGGGGYSQALADAVWYAYTRGCIVCCAAGNSGRGKVEYPAAYPGALAVSSVGPSGKRAYYSSYGDQVWIAAPGGDKSAQPEDGVLQNTIDPRERKSFYGFWQGTSMATPHVAGVAALLVERGVTKPDAVFNVLAETAKNSKNGEWDRELGWGVIDAAAAVEQAGAPDRAALVGGLALCGAWLFATRKDRKVAGALAVLGTVLGACGIPLVRDLAGIDLPVLDAFADWDRGNPLLASALVPAFLGFASVRWRGLRSAAIGFMLGGAAHLGAMAAYGYTDIAWIPGTGLLDTAWLAGNGAALVVGAAMVVRLARGRGVA